MLARTGFPFFMLQLKAISAYLFSGYVIFTIQDQQQTVVFTSDYWNAQIWVSVAIGSKGERAKDKTAERYWEVNRGRKWRGGDQRERDRHGGKLDALDLKNGREVRERKRKWKKDSRRWNRQLMDCLLWADSGMSTDSHLHEQALSSKESMSQPPSPPLSLTNTHTDKMLQRSGYIGQFSYITLSQ